MSQQGSPPRKPLPALRLFEASDLDQTGVQERLGFSSEESTMITALERLDGRDSTGISPLSDDVEELSIDSMSDLSTASSPPSTSNATLRSSVPPALSSVQTPPVLASLTPPEFTPPEFIPPDLGYTGSALKGAPNFQTHPDLPERNNEISTKSEDSYPLHPQGVDEQSTDEFPSEVVNSSHSSFMKTFPSTTKPRSHGGLMITGFNARGGVGCTSLLLTLAGALQCRDFKVVLVDMDLQLATLSSSLDVKLERSLAELVMEAQVSEGPIRSAFDYHRSGIAVIAQEERISEISHVTPERLPRLFAALRQNFDVVLVDGLRNFSDIAVAVMDDADMVLLPVTQDIPAVRSARKVLKLFARLGYEGGKSRVILNRFHKRSLVTDSVIEEHLHCVISEQLPNDFRFVAQGLAEGELLHLIDPKHPYCLAIDRLAAQLLGFPAPVQKQSLLSRLFGGRS